jgi:uncharacterized repeat protein (TIGR01451 family)
MTRASFTPLRAIPVLIALIFNIVLVAPAAQLATPAAALTGSSFDATDGNLAIDGGETDWCTPVLGVVTKTDLPTGQTDDSYAEGAKENDTNPPVEFGSIPNNKVDLKRIYVAGETGVGGDLYVNVGWVRGDDNGTGTISFELNQSGVLLSNGANNQRTIGDLLITFNFGGGAFEDLTVRTWNGSAWVNEVDLDGTGLGDGSVNEGSISECLAGETLGDGLFGEFSFNLTDLLGGDCRAFASLFAKSRASNAIESKLKELITPVSVDLSTCGQLTILKQDESQQALGGATFSVTPNPFTETGSLSVTDNEAPDDDATAGTIHLSEVEPGAYSVCETAAPAGYIIDTTCVEQTVAVNGAATFGPFTNGLGDVSWTKVDDETGLALCCATFSVQGTAGPAVGFGPVTVVDNGTNDADPDAGELLVAGLKLGNYRITETVAPTGYDLPSPLYQDVVLAGETGSPAGAFRDAPHPTLTVVKTPDGAVASSGDAIEFTVVTTNNGPGTALAVGLTDTLPAVANGWQLGSEDWSGDCDITGAAGGTQSLSCDSEDIPAGESRSVAVTTTTSADDCGVLLNSASADGSNTEPAGDDGDVLVQCPGLNILKVASADHINAGDAATFTISIWNAGPGDAFDVIFDDELPVGLNWQWEIVSEHDPESCSSSANQDGTLSISCTFTELAPSSMTDGVVIAVWAETDRSDCGELVNTAFADSSNNPRGELSATDSLIVDCPTLVVDKAADADVITISGPANALVTNPSVVTWTLTYTLDGGPVTNAVITDEIPAGLDYVPGSATDGGQLVDGILTWSFPTLAASGSVTFQTAVDVETISRTGPTVNMAVIVSDQTPEDEGSDEVRVVVEPPVLGGTPTPRPSVPDTAIGIGLDSQPVTIPVELLAVLFIGSLGALAFANVRAVQERRR